MTPAMPVASAWSGRDALAGRAATAVESALRNGRGARCAGGGGDWPETAQARISTANALARSSVAGRRATAIVQRGRCESGAASCVLYQRLPRSSTPPRGDSRTTFDQTTPPKL
jgi:hypothetical protein